jgi:ATP-dependent DNA helicase RecQ
MNDTTKEEVLKSVFGFSGFRPLQQEAVDTILNRRDLLMILPTGGGKSLCYQLPALLMEGLTVVVSPLLALMHDQVSALKALGIKAEMLSSMQNAEESELIRTRLFQGDIKLLYVAPERLSNDYFLQMLSRLPLALFVIDEAHCVSEWGHEFRDDYRRLGFLKERFPSVGIAAFTATATQKVQQDITTQLRIADQQAVREARRNPAITLHDWSAEERRKFREIAKGQWAEMAQASDNAMKVYRSITAYLEDNGLL